MKTIVIFLSLLFATTAQAYTLTIDIPTDKAITVLNNCAVALRYQEQIEDPDNPGEMIPNPISKKATLLRKLKEVLKSMNEEGQIIASTQEPTLSAIEQSIIDTEGITVK